MIKYIIFNIIRKILLGLYIILLPLQVICLIGIWLKELIENVRSVLYNKCVDIKRSKRFKI